jgi:hypothetical protein
MAILWPCPGCGTQLRLREEQVGAILTCPKCARHVSTAGPVEEVTAAARPPLPAEPAWNDPSLERQRSPNRGSDDSDEDDRFRLPRSRYVPCPRCGGTYAERVIWTAWGSFYGPALLCHVRCVSCGATYNGRSGRSNTIAAFFFVMVPLVLIMVICAVLGWWVWYNLRPGPR